jgi:glycylpeptide N-tetradecanoyltransferase
MGDAQNGNSDKLGKDADNIAGKASQIMKLMEQLSRMRATEEQPETTREHKFWTTQPVLKSTASPEDIQDGPIEPSKQVESVRVEPYLLPAEFQWCIVSVHDPAQRDELYQLLNLRVAVSIRLPSTIP